MAARCKRVTFKKRNGRALPKSKWVTVQRCKGKKLKAHNSRQCRRGGQGWRAKAKRGSKTAALFTEC